MPENRLQAIEFRDPSWYHPEVDRLLAERGIARCVHEMTGSRSPLEPVGPFVYLRLHGAGERYGGRYADADLERWADRLRSWAALGRDAHVYFNNDGGGHAPRDAERLRRAVGGSD